MKIKSKVDVITNSSTEVFILKDPETSAENINARLREHGFKGRVFKFGEGTHEDLDLLPNVFCNSETRDFSWMSLYFHDYLGYAHTKDNPFSENLLDIQKKYAREILVPIAEEMFVSEETDELEKENLGLFINDPDLNFNFFIIFSVDLDEKREVLLKWFEENKSEFPPYQEVLKMFYRRDIKELEGLWIDLWDNDSGIDYLGNVEGKFNCERVKLC